MSAVAVASGDAEDLARAKAVLLEQGSGKRRLGPEALRTALVDLHDFWLSSRAAAIGLTDRAALVAVGALGRRELAPWSDLDLVLLHDGPQGRRPTGPSSCGTRCGTPGSGSTTPSARPARPSRWPPPTCGPRSACSRPGTSPATPRSRTRSAPPSASPGGPASAAASTSSPTAPTSAGRKVGDVAHRVEPDLKNGHGGLRDVQLIDALAAAQLVDRPAADVQAARMLLLDVRTELHRLAGRARDVLRAQDADEVAAALEISRPVRAGPRAVGRGPVGRVRGRGGAALGPHRPAAARARRAAPRAGAPPAGHRRRRARRRGGAGPGRLRGPRSGAGAAGGRHGRAHRPADRRRHPAPARRHRPGAAGTLAAGGARRAAVAAGHRPPAGRRRGVARPHRAVGAAVPRVGRGARPAAARPGTRLDGRPAPRGGLRPVGAAHHAGGAAGPAAGRRAAARHRQGPRRRPLRRRGVARRAGGQAAGLRRTRTSSCSAAMVRHHLLLPHTATRRDLDDPATVTRVVETLDGDAAAAGAAGGAGRGRRAGHRPGCVEPVEAGAHPRSRQPLPGTARRRTA